MRRVSAKLLALLPLVALTISLPGCPPPNDGPEAAFTASVRQGTAPLTVQFTDTSQAGAGAIQAWAWDFGDGQISSQRHPQVTYLRAGSYSVSLTVTSAFGTNTRTEHNMIAVTEDTAFQGVGPQGGAVLLKGVGLTIPAGALPRQVVFGVGEDDRGLLLNTFETLQVISPTFSIRHNGATDRMFGTALGNAVQPARLELPFRLEAIPLVNGMRDVSKLQILAQLENGLTLPILGRAEGSRFIASVMRLPASASYAVVYRPESFQGVVDIPNLAKAPTSYNWKQRWNVNFSLSMIREMTALRLGELRNPASYSQMNFSSEQLNETADKIAAGIQLVQKGFSESGLRSPALLNENDAYTLIFYNMNTTASPQYNSFQELSYRSHLFGSLVIDPMMLLNIAAHNAVGLQQEPARQDPAQVISFANAFGQELFAASNDGYDYPVIADNKGVNVLDGLKGGVGTYLGQFAGWLDEHDIPVPLELLLHFNELDANGSGGLTLAEAQVRLGTLGLAEFAAIDANADNELQRSELEDSLTTDEEAEGELLADLVLHFADLDANKDGGLTLAEARNQRPALSQAEFNKFDVNKDQKLQRFELSPRARGFEANEYTLLSNPLFAPADASLKGYAVANQEFFFYTQYSNPDASALGYLLSHEPLARGILDEVRAALATETIPGVELTYEDAVPVIARAADRAIQSNLHLSLAEAYWNFARDRGVANTPLAGLRPSDLERKLFTLNEDRFAANALVKAQLLAPTDSADITSDFNAALRNIPPLCSRAVLLSINPLTQDLTLAFNPKDWEADALGNSIAVSVFRQGLPGDELSTDGIDTDADGINDTLTIEGFLPDLEDCTSKIVLLISNLSLDTANSVDIKVDSFAGMPVDENEVLDTYVHFCDPSYDYTLESSSSIPSLGVNVYQIKMSSGAWRGTQDVNQPVWRHYVSIIEPPIIASTTAMLMISGGSTDSTPSTSFAQTMVPFALSTGTVVALIQAVPNEPLQFEGETRTRSEDAIIAYSYDKYMVGYTEDKPDMTWPALLPMTRAAVRAMDTIQLFMGRDKPGLPAFIEHFVVSGASKRGWTTWLTAAADSRVTAIMPIVIDVLNMAKQMDHQFKSYGTYSDAVQDYVDSKIFTRFDKPEGLSLLQIVDPYSYRAHLTMPKLMVNSTGDQFFLPDSSRFFLYNPNAADNVPGENYEYYAPNTDHSLISADGGNVDMGAYNSMLAFYNAFVRDVARPVFHWSVAGNTITLQAETKPSSVKLWQAKNRSSRDFRLETIGESWTSTDLCPVCDGQPQSDCTAAEGEGEGEGEPCDSGTYIGEVEVPEPGAGWVAFFIQATFPGPDANLDGVDFGFSSRVVVLPDTYPSSSAR